MKFERKIIGFNTIVEEEIPDDIFAFLSHPEFFDMICEQEISKTVEGEQDAIKTIELVAQGGRLVKNAAASSTNLLVNSSSSSGKDWTCGNSLKILPKDAYIKRTRISPTVFTYWHNPRLEPDWTWEGKVFYLEDISSSVLNSDVFKVMASGGSSATIVINQFAVDIEIKGKPIMITTTAAATPEPELVRRFPIVSLNETNDQTRAILIKQGKFAEKGKTPEYNPKIKEALSYLQQTQVIVPFAGILAQIVPADHVIMRTNFPRLLDYIKFSTAIFQFQRKQNQEEYFIATSQDYEYAKIAIKKTMNSGIIPLTRDQKKILEAIKKLNEKNPTLNNYWAISEINANVTLSYKWLQKQLNLLTDYGYLAKDSQKKDYSDKNVTVFCLASEHNIDLPDWKTIEEKMQNNTIPSNPNAIEAIAQEPPAPELQKTENKELATIELQKQYNSNK